MTMREILRVGRGTVMLIVAVSLGLVLVNPVGLYYNLLWLLPFATSPLMLYHFCGPRARPVRHGDGRPVDHRKDPRLSTAVDRPRTRW